ncbi:winged helix-turn-helix domain-containing protein [Streptomyces sp. NPDC002952]|uniref:helix-turn-helix domain-containing protein n=1 Tax=Streptomyces sp. NPDC002952 TaxID=3364673 RepID=UPI00367B1954
MSCRDPREQRMRQHRTVSHTPHQQSMPNRYHTPTRKTLIGRLFHVSYTVEGTWLLLKRHGWSWQQPAWRAIERDDTSVGVWKEETWPRVRASRRSGGPGSSLRTRPGSR